MLRAFLRTVHGNLIAKPRVALGLSYGVNNTQRKALEDVVYRAGVRRVHLLDQAIAAAVGAGLEVTRPVGGLLVDVGAGTTTVAVLSMGGVVVSRSAPVGGDAVDAAIRTLLRQDHGLLVGDRQAETVKIEIAAAFPGAASGDLAPVYGRDAATGLPRTVHVCAEDVRLALAGPLASIIEAVMGALEDCPPELAGDLVDTGLVLTGGGSLLPGLDTLLQEETGIPVRRADRPRASVVLGVAHWLEAAETAVAM
jgi:rod shape-determining protein MreB